MFRIQYLSRYVLILSIIVYSIDERYQWQLYGHYLCPIALTGKREYGFAMSAADQGLRDL